MSDHHSRHWVATSILIVTAAPTLLLFACGPANEQPVQTASMATTATTSSAPAKPTGPRHHLARMASARGRGQLKLVYGPMKGNQRQEIVDTFKEERLFEDVIDSLNEGLVLPHDVRVVLKDCGEINAFYDPNAKSVFMCYELFDHFTDIFMRGETQQEREDGAGKAVAALVFAFYHELGHALIDVYDLPVTGREEDAVDQLATVLLLETWEGEDSELAILSSAEWFELDASEREDEADMSDEHALDEQRYYNLVCWTYGSDPEYFSDLADDWGLPPARAERCSGEYARMSSAWNTLLGPHMRPAS